MLNKAVLNVYRLYKKQSINGKLTHTEFWLKLADQIMERGTEKQ